jgi:exo-beta-1,3-glucanase (GH17 family)
MPKFWGTIFSLSVVWLVTVGCEVHVRPGKTCNELIDTIRHGKTYLVDHGFYEGLFFTAEKEVTFYSLEGKLIDSEGFVIRREIDARSLFAKCRGQ